MMTREEAVKEIEAEFNEFLKGTGLDNEECLKSAMEINGDLRKVVEANRIAIKVLKQKPSRDMKEIEEIIDCDADAETKCKMISNILTAEPHYFEEQQPYEDDIKREFIEILINYPPVDLCIYPEYKGKPYYSILYRGEDGRNHVGFGTYKIEILSQWIKQYFMSNAQPKQKIGHWIEGKYKDDDIRYNDSSYKCDKCGKIVDFKEKLCPDCGAKMLPTDSEKER